ncbi:MAG: hypothetical protein IKM33_05440 [Clostridia bacterium]|nr:hypothetical protein [Clostridia bacterium]
MLSAAACSTSTQSYEKQKAAYDGIIAEYTALLTAKQNGEELSAPDTRRMNEREAAIAEALYGIVDWQGAETVGDLGYGFKDMDGNGTPELILLSRYTSIRAVFTLVKGKPVLLEACFGKGSHFIFATNNRFFMGRKTVTDNIEEMKFYTCHVDGGKMAYDSVYGHVYDQEKKETLEYYQMVDGNRVIIDEETFNVLYREHRYVTAYSNGEMAKLEAPYIHLPLAEPVFTENLPVADFSTYDAVLKTYTAISACVESFNSSQWVCGGYDNLFTYPDDLSYEYYNRLLYAAYHNAYYEGYDEIDLNGDGQDELVILNEDYTIKAIFTMKKGKPVLLDSFAYETYLLDEEGRIHADRLDSKEIEYSLYEFTKEGDYRLVYSILATSGGYEGHYYLTEDGQTQAITYEKFKEIYEGEHRNCYTEPFEVYEYSRSVSNLTYTPLTPPTEDLIRTAASKTWYKSASLDKTSGEKYGAYSNTYVTFENVTNTQMGVHVKYAYTVLYPDPDRENYLLGETTESYLDFTAHAENGIFTFDGNGIKGHLEFSNKYLWLVIEESADKRFPVGYHCYKVYTPDELEY